MCIYLLKLDFLFISHGLNDRIDSSLFLHCYFYSLAVTSMWWRGSSIALVLSGLLPDQIGSSMRDEHPTLTALIR